VHPSYLKETIAMVTSIASASAAPNTRGTGEARASVALQDKLSRCEQQLGDWQACPSRKTPEGKKIIEGLQTQIRNLESRLASTGSANAPQAQASASAPATATGTVTSSSNYAGLLGSTLDVYA
jgi:hypothetical protein